MPDALAESARARLLFRVDGLPLRDELVIKSLVRLLGHRTHHHWTYNPDQADLDIVGNVVDAVGEQSASASLAGQVLRVGRIKKHPGPFLSLPVHSNELELMLNDLGKRISESRRAALAMPGRADSHDEFRLLKWPPAALLAGQGRMKVATLIMGRPMSAMLLAQRSGVAMEECTCYLRELRERGFLEVSAAGTACAQGRDCGAAPPPPVKEKLAAGLLARIRSRLGLTA